MMARREHTKRWLSYLVILYCIMTKEIATQPVYTSVTGNANDALIVSNELVYLQLRQTQRVPCGKQTGFTTDVIAATWYDTKKNEIIRFVADPIDGSNFTSPKYEGRASFTKGFDLTLRDVNDGDTGSYKCEIITATDPVNYKVEVIVIDKQLPKRSAVRSVSQLLQAGKNTVHCPVYNRSITRPTIYYSIRRDFIRSSTDILVSRFSDGSVLVQDSTFDIQRDANYSLVIKKPETAPAEMLIWCHVSSDVDEVNLMSGFVNVTQFQPAETSNSVWIALVCLGMIILIILCVAAVFYHRRRWRPESPSSSEEMTPINLGPINNESCEDYKLKNVIQKGGKKGKVLNDFFSSLRLVTVAGNGDLVMLDGKGMRVMSKKYYKKVTFQIRADLIKEYVAIAASKRQAGEVLVARRSGKISWHDNSSGKEVEIQGCSSHPPGEISDMDVDDEGTIYVAGIVKDVIYSYSVDGSFNTSAFAIKDSPKCISACEGGILYVLSGTRIKRGEGYDIEGGTISRYTNGERDDYDIKCPTDMNIVTTGLYSSKTSVYVLAKSAGSDKAEASAILQYSASDGHLQRRIIEDWPGILGIVFIRDDYELAFFDSKEVKVYERQKVMRKKPRREDSSSHIV